MLDLENRSPARLAYEPFPYLVAHDVLGTQNREGLDRDFPRYASAGFFPYAPEDCGPAMRELLDRLESPSFADWLGGHLGIERLSSYPTLVTICRQLNRRHGTIHTDSRSKVATALLYLNHDWPHGSDGCLRFLSQPDDIDACVVPEIPPIYGTLTAFRRTDCSFHGHLPFEGERRVIQVAWLADASEKERKIKRGRASRLVKRWAGALDRLIGSGRSRNAAHRD